MMMLAVVVMVSILCDAPLWMMLLLAVCCLQTLLLLPLTWQGHIAILLQDMWRGT